MPDVAGGGHINIALEATRGTYSAPSKTVPIVSETLQEVRTDPWREPILGRAVVSGKVKGRAGVEGTIVIEAMPEAMAYFLIASRMGNNVTKTGASAPFTYSAVDDAAAHVKGTLRSLTIGVSRAGIGFAYLGCQVVQSRLFFTDGIPMMEYTIMGLNETTDYATPGSVTEPGETPFAADETTVKVATTARTDIDSLEINLNDSGELRYNLSAQEAADYVRFGEFIGEASFEIDFESKADYAIWKARTTQELIAELSKSANQKATFELHGALYDTFDVGLAGLGDQVRASVGMRAAYASADSAAAKIDIITDEDITLS